MREGSRRRAPSRPPAVRGLLALQGASGRAGAARGGRCWRRWGLGAGAESRPSFPFCSSSSFPLPTPGPFSSSFYGNFLVTASRFLSCLLSTNPSFRCRYLIDSRWFKQWKKYVGFDSWDLYNVGEPNLFPGPIDNSGLFAGRSYRRGARTGSLCKRELGAMAVKRARKGPGQMPCPILERCFALPFHSFPNVFPCFAGRIWVSLLINSDVDNL